MTINNQDKKLLSTDEVAQYIGASRSTTVRLMEAHEVEVVRPGKNIKVSPEVAEQLRQLLTVKMEKKKRAKASAQARRQLKADPK